jgi:murein DD-endopeptidase MepM/ murein hydrolase activator NlpD
VLAIAGGTVVYAGSDYPGLVVIVQHADELFSMYGHLEYDAEVEVGEPVTRGQRIGAVLRQVGGRAPSHLHVEVRTFLTTPEINGDAPRYGYGCGVDCPPGPGYWPIDAPEHPSEMGWRNPTHVIARRMFPDGKPSAGTEVVVASTAGETTELWSAPPDSDGAAPLGNLPLSPGHRYPLHAVTAGPPSAEGTSAERYRLWYQTRCRRATPGSAPPSQMRPTPAPLAGRRPCASRSCRP